MEKEHYLEQLMQRSAYCACPGLAELFEKRKAARDLEARCEFFKSNADLEHPTPEDEEFLLDYRQEVDNLKHAVHEYYRSLYQHAAQGRVYFALHDATQEKVTEMLSVEKAQRLLKENKPLISIHCSRCDQQIDVASSVD